MFSFHVVNGVLNLHVGLDSKVLNHPRQTGRFNFTTQFPHYKEVFYKPHFGNKNLGKPLVFDMDMSAGDFLALFYLLKVPVEAFNLKVRKTPFYSFHCGFYLVSNC